MEQFSQQHLQYVVPAVTILFFLGFCPTLFLCLFSTRFFVRFFRCGPRMQLFLRTFTDAFQSCYKDGLNGTYDFRFLSSVPMFSYILLVIRSFIVDSQKSYVFVIYCGISFLSTLVFAYSRPFKTLYMNFSFSFYSTVVGLMFGMYYLWFESDSISSHSLALMWTFFLSLPHLFAFFTVVYYILSWFHCTQRITLKCLETILTLFRHIPDELRPLLPGRCDNQPLRDI